MFPRLKYLFDRSPKNTHHTVISLRLGERRRRASCSIQHTSDIQRISCERDFSVIIHGNLRDHESCLSEIGKKGQNPIGREAFSSQDDRPLEKMWCNVNYTFYKQCPKSR